MKVFSLVKNNTYFDSVTLMGVSKRLSELEKVRDISVSMGTELNRTLLRSAQMSTAQTEAATPNDLMIVFHLDDENYVNEAIEQIEKALQKRRSSASEKSQPVGLKSALAVLPEANLALISLPGEYAAFEAKRALQQGLHVMLFSDNVRIEDELMLKTLAHEKGLLCMGPDCGTAIVNQKALCFANVVDKGRIGVIGASGTGTQEITVLLDQYGQGVSQVLGTGGRDLSKTINALMMCDALEALAEDAQTELIILVSKPPEDSVAQKVYQHAAKINKPVIACFLSENAALPATQNIHFANTLEQGAQLAISLLDRDFQCEEEQVDRTICTNALRALNKEQKFARGIFCGGTLTEEARIVFKQALKQALCYGNTAKKETEQLSNPFVSQGHCFVDMGDDAFTVGKPHPMIDPELRNSRLVQEAKDPSVAVILVDVVLGFGSHEDPAGVTLQGILQAQRAAKEQGRTIVFVAYVLGTEKDPQHLHTQIQKLKNAGVILGKTNAHAARIAAAIIEGI